MVILFLSTIFCNLFGLSIQPYLQNLDSLAQEMSELCSILWFGGHFVFDGYFKIHNLLGQSIWTSMKNLESVSQKMCRLSIRTSMQNLESVSQKWALGTKEDGHLSIIYIQAIIQSKLHFSYSQSLDKRAKIKLISVPGAISSKRNCASGGGHLKIIFFVNVKILKNAYFSIR